MAKVESSNTDRAQYIHGGVPLSSQKPKRKEENGREGAVTSAQFATPDETRPRSTMRTAELRGLQREDGRSGQEVSDSLAEHTINSTCSKGTFHIGVLMSQHSHSPIMRAQAATRPVRPATCLRVPWYPTCLIGSGRQVSLLLNSLKSTRQRAQQSYRELPTNPQLWSRTITADSWTAVNVGGSNAPEPLKFPNCFKPFKKGARPKTLRDLCIARALKECNISETSKRVQSPIWKVPFEHVELMNFKTFLRP
ncbi:hypothetical protein K438DRAFT_1764866 [Mycena galopus ATCC 62051]|nr:hypothetical protein K438DRAFT_1764866 [Mycena galopus ATCC 62051]